MNILVTGSCGQLGRAIREVSKEYDHKCFFTDMTGDECDFQLDITDADSVGKAVEDNQVDVIINCAAYTDVEKAEDEEDAAVRVNADAPGILARVAESKGALLVHISTDYVFDGHSWLPYGEEDMPSPLSAYARTKYDGDKAIIGSGCRYLIFRTAWMYSDKGRNFFTRIVDLTAEKPTLAVVADQIGTPTYAPDLASAIFHIIDNRRDDITGIYNYTDEGICSWYDFAQAICRGVGHTCRIVPCRTGEYPSKAARPHYSVLDKTRIKRDFGLDIPHWRDSLEVCISEYEKQ